MTPSQTVDQFFGAVTASSFCAAGVDDGVCAFGVPAVGELGSAGVGTLRAPSVFNMDAMVAKKFRITESKSLQFRAEFFNFLNHVSWGPRVAIFHAHMLWPITSQAQGPRNIQFGLKLFF